MRWHLAKSSSTLPCGTWVFTGHLLTFHLSWPGNPNRHRRIESHVLKLGGVHVRTDDANRKARAIAVEALQLLTSCLKSLTSPRSNKQRPAALSDLPVILHYLLCWACRCVSCEFSSCRCRERSWRAWAEDQRLQLRRKPLHMKMSATPANSMMLLLTLLTVCQIRHGRV